ncbi:MAG: 3-oxoacyl-ACP synthase III family protein [Bdellovibrionota bacterium]
MRKASIVGTGLYHPEKLVPNSYFNERYKTDIDTFLRTKRNIHQRYFMAENQATSDLIIPAVEQSLQNAGITKDEVDLLIVCTDTPDYLSPSTASVVQHKMGLVNAGTFDLNSACAGFVSGLDVASKYIMADERYRNIVVVGAYGMSKYLDWDVFQISSLFADGAGAVVVRATEKPEDPGIMASKLFTLGEFYDYMGVYGGGTAKPITHESIDRKENLLNFAKKIPLETNSVHWPRLVNLLLDRTNRKLSDVSRFFLTQINIGTIEATMDALGVSRDLSYNIMDRYGYTGSACIPMAIADAVNHHKLKKGDFLMLVGSGGGVAMASMALEWAYDT